jgi:hypothetical protein
MTEGVIRLTSINGRLIATAIELIGRVIELMEASTGFFSSVRFTGEPITFLKPRSVGSEQRVRALARGACPRPGPCRR